LRWNRLRLRQIDGIRRCGLRRQRLSRCRQRRSSRRKLTLVGSRIEDVIDRALHRWLRSRRNRFPLALVRGWIKIIASRTLYRRRSSRSSRSRRRSYNRLASCQLLVPHLSGIAIRYDGRQSTARAACSTAASCSTAPTAGGGTRTIPSGTLTKEVERLSAAAAPNGYVSEKCPSTNLHDLSLRWAGGGVPRVLNYDRISPQWKRNLSF